MPTPSANFPPHEIVRYGSIWKSSFALGSCTDACCTSRYKLIKYQNNQYYAERVHNGIVIMNDMCMGPLASLLQGYELVSPGERTRKKSGFGAFICRIENEKPKE